MRLRWPGTLCLLILLAIEAGAIQRGIRGQLFLPNGSPAERTTRFTLSYENGLRQEQYFTDSHGRLAIQQDINTPYTITVESDGENYDTTRTTFYPPSSGNYIVINLRPLATPRAPVTGVVDASRLDQSIAPKAREAYDSALSLLQSQQYEPAINLLTQAVAL